MNFRPTRRTFLKTLGAAGLTAPYVTRNLIAQSPSRTLRHVSFGAAGMAWSDIQAICSNPFVKLVAVAEVDLNRTKQLKDSFPDVKVYQDWRELLDKEQNNFDSANVSTPDHLHGRQALSLMQLGKHVYCEKPLASNLHETRVLTDYARQRGLVTQMGIQIHSQKVYRQAVAIVQSGAIGKVKEVHTWSSKKWGDKGPPPAKADPVPAGFNWDLWLAGAQPRPYVQGHYHPGNWRKRLDFGTGTFGDMGCHIFDPVFAALALTAPVSVRSEGPAPDQWNWAIDARIRYIFPGTQFTAGNTVAVTWYDGDQRPPADIMALIPQQKPADLVSLDDAGKARAKAKRVTPDDNQGSIIIGTKGVLHVPHVATPKLYPVADFRDYKLPEIMGTHHWSDWAEACVGGPGKPAASFDYSGPLTEAVLLGSVAVRFPQTTLQWNSAKLQFDNERAANQFIRARYAKGWELAAM